MVESHEPETIQQLDTIYNTYNTKRAGTQT